VRFWPPGKSQVWGREMGSPHPLVRAVATGPEPKPWSQKESKPPVKKCGLAEMRQQILETWQSIEKRSPGMWEEDGRN
jgi:hypothetical protein